MTDGQSPIPTIRNCLPIIQGSDLYNAEQYLNFVCIIVLELSVFQLLFYIRRLVDNTCRCFVIDIMESEEKLAVCVLF